MPEYIYQFLPGDRAEMAIDPDAWTKEDQEIGSSHYAYLEEATARGTVILAGRSPDGVGPAVVVFEAEDEFSARQFMEQDPFVSSGLFRAELHLFRVALMREPHTD